MVGMASLMGGTLEVVLAFSSLTGYQRVSYVSSWACADGTIVPARVEARCAVSIGAAWIGVAQIRGSERSAGFERMTSVSSGAGTYGLMVFHLAVGSGSAGAFAGIHALQLEAGLVTRAVVVGSALGIAPAVAITLVELRTRADGAAVPNVTVSSFTTSVAAKIYTDVVSAAQFIRTIGIADAFRFATV